MDDAPAINQHFGKRARRFNSLENFLILDSAQNLHRAGWIGNEFSDACPDCGSHLVEA